MKYYKISESDLHDLLTKENILDAIFCAVNLDSSTYKDYLESEGIIEKRIHKYKEI